MKIIHQVNVYSIIVIFSLMALATSLYSKNCHYSCTYCVGPEYDRCIICHQGLNLSPIKNKDKIGQLYYNSLQDHPTGSCLGESLSFNIFGLLTFFITVIMFILLRNRTIFYFLNAIQTFALFSLIQVGYSEFISYILKGLQYFMFVSSVLKDTKQQKIEIYNDGRYRLNDFMREYNFQTNFLPVFICSALVFVFVFAILVCKHFAKNQSIIWRLCRCVNINKVFTFLEISSIAVFFFLIQQTLLIIVIEFFFNHNFIDNPLNIGLVVIYVLMLIVMIINLCGKNIDFFANKALMQTQIVKKTLTPIFVIIPLNMSIILPVFVFFIALLGLIFCRLRPSDKTLTSFHQKLIKRQIFYRIIQLLAIGGIIIFWLVEKKVQTVTSNKYAGYASACIIGIYLVCFLVETGILIYGKFCQKQDQKLYEIRVNSMSSMRQGKMEDTLQNFQNTQEGIMDMIFFGRNIEEKESPKKNNIQINLDHLNQQFEEQPEHKVSKSATTSPKHHSFKNRTSRTPKNDRSARFKLNKVSELENKKVDIEQIEMNEQNISKQNNGKVHLIGDKSQRSQHYPQVKTGRKYDSFKAGREMKRELEQEENSPRFGMG